MSEKPVIDATILTLMPTVNKNATCKRYIKLKQTTDVTDLIITPFLPFSKGGNHINVVKFQFVQVVGCQPQYYASNPLGQLCRKLRDVSICQMLRDFG